MEDIPTGNREILRIIRTLFKILYFTKLENLKNMDDFLDRYGLPKLNQYQMTNLSTPLTVEEGSWTLFSDADFNALKSD